MDIDTWDVTGDKPPLGAGELVELAESLACSTEWRRTARAMRHLREQWKAIEERETGLDPELVTRFRAAQQTFMDRRADYYQRGNLRKGAGLADQLEKRQEELAVMRGALSVRFQTLQEFENQLQTLPHGPHEGVVRGFIQESMLALQEEIRQQEAALERMERSVGILSSRYYCVE